MGNIWTQQLLTHTDNQLITPKYVRRLIDRHYDFYNSNISITHITTFIQTTYSPNITDEMIEEALRLEPHVYFNQINSHTLLYA